MSPMPGDLDTTSEWMLTRAAERRHDRVHGGLPVAGGRLCQVCLRLTIEAAGDLDVLPLWQRVNELNSQIMGVRRKDRS